MFSKQTSIWDIPSPQSHRSMNVLQYADDTCLIASGPACCQQLLMKVEKWLQWSAMKAKVLKCHTLAIQASSGKRYDPKLQLNGETIPFIANKPSSFWEIQSEFSSPAKTTNNTSPTSSRLFTAADHTSAASPSVSLMSCPC